VTDVAVVPAVAVEPTVSPAAAKAVVAAALRTREIRGRESNGVSFEVVRPWPDSRYPPED
jgi:hypothetical protein